MSKPTTRVVMLTQEQCAALKEHFAHVNVEADAKRPGMLVAQVFDANEAMPAHMLVGFIPCELCAPFVKAAGDA